MELYERKMGSFLAGVIMESGGGIVTLLKLCLKLLFIEP